MNFISCLKFSWLSENWLKFWNWVQFWNGVKIQKFQDDEEDLQLLHDHIKIVSHHIKVVSHHIKDVSGHLQLLQLTTFKSSLQLFYKSIQLLFLRLTSCLNTQDEEDEDEDDHEDEGENHLVIKVIQWSKLSCDNSHVEIMVIFWVFLW